MYDYEILNRCNYPVPSAGTPDPHMDCGEPAPYRVWWDDGGEMIVCKEHFQFIETTEEND